MSIAKAIPFQTTFVQGEEVDEQAAMEICLCLCRPDCSYRREDPGTKITVTSPAVQRREISRIGNRDSLLPARFGSAQSWKKSRGARFSETSSNAQPAFCRGL